MRRASAAAQKRQRRNRYLFVRFQQAAAAVALSEQRGDAARAAVLFLEAADFADPAAAGGHLATLRSHAADDGAATAATQALTRLAPHRSPAPARR